VSWLVRIYLARRAAALLLRERTLVSALTSKGDAMRSSKTPSDFPDDPQKTLAESECLKGYSLKDLTNVAQANRMEQDRGLSSTLDK
jgi:hypothetical protein